MCQTLGKNEQPFWFCWCFPTNRAHALDLCLVSMSRTHFSQLLENPTSEDPRSVNMHTKTSLVASLIYLYIFIFLSTYYKKYKNILILLKDKWV